MGACASACSDDHDRRSSSTDVEPPGLNGGRPKPGRGFGANATTATGTADNSPKQRNSPSNGNGNGNGQALDGSGGHSPNGANGGGSGRRNGEAETGSSGAAGAGAGGGNEKGSGRKRSSSNSNSSDRSGAGGGANGNGDSSSGRTGTGTTPPGTSPIIPAMSSIPPNASALAEEHQKDSVPQPPLRKQGSGNALLTLPGKTPIPAKKYTFLLPETIVESPAMSPNGSRGGSPTHGSGTGAGAAGLSGANGNGNGSGHGSGPASPTFATNIRFTHTAAARTAELMARARELEVGGAHGLAVQSLSPTNADGTDATPDALHSGRSVNGTLSGHNSSRRGSTGNGNGAGSGRGGGSGVHHPLGLHVRAGSGGSGGGSMELIPTPALAGQSGPGGPDDVQPQPQLHPSSVTPVLAASPAVADSACAAGAGAGSTASGTGDGSTGDRTCSDSASPPTAAHTAAAPPSTAGSTGTRAGDKAGVENSPLWRPNTLHASAASTTAGSAASSARGSTVSAASDDAGAARASSVLLGTGAWARAEPPAAVGGFADANSRRSSAGPNSVAA